MPRDRLNRGENRRVSEKNDEPYGFYFRAVFLLFFSACGTRFCVLSVQAVAYNVQMLEFLPQRLKKAIALAGENAVYEIRIRRDYPVKMNYRGKYVYLGERGAEAEKRNAFICDGKEIDDILYCAGNFSVYSVEEQIRRGFISADGGVRVGIAGEYSFADEKVLALKQAESLCIRVPHRIENAGAEIYDIALKCGLKNTLIVSAPGRGKTTILRDLAEKIAAADDTNLLICDERGEIAPCGALKGADVISYVDKKQAFSMAIRAMRPDLIVTDELSEDDLPTVKRAIRSGVYVLASAHFGGIEELTDPFRGIFDVIVCLSSDRIGKIAGIYDKCLKPLI